MLPLWWRRPGESLPLEPSKGRDKSNKAINEILRNFHTIRRRPWALTVALFSFSGGHIIFLTLCLVGKNISIVKVSRTFVNSYILLYVRLCEWVWAGEWWVARRLMSREGWLQLLPTPVLTHTHLVTGDMSRVTCQGVSRGAASRHTCFNDLLLTNKICIIYNVNSNIGFPHRCVCCREASQLPSSCTP